MTVTAGTLDVPGAQLYYELRGEGPLVVLVGSPMDAGPFAPLADLLADDHTVLTTDPRGVGRSPVENPDEDATPELRAADLSRLISEVDAGPAAVLGSSGGAVTALALAQAHPGQAHTVIAHEPPLYEVLEERKELVARSEDMIATYLGGDATGAWRIFMEIAGMSMPEEIFQHMFAERTEKEAAEDRRFFVHTLRPTTQWVPELVALAAGSTRLVIGIGEQSAGELCDRTSRALAASLGVEPVLFPGDHAGFMGDPKAFADRLREVMAGR
ncbi:hydrolase [Planotetraspora thailandica]|uniref:Hydrolase n=1 Tax=Planotetraspora thailandica TaxID=487172 RepID=A0A8J3XTX1_9ACTN|nr:alpha/beta hydrolase [Planotetraspora thailandica]GII52609.1 hydrolase [Planotetraspora thailandica]